MLCECLVWIFQINNPALRLHSLKKEVTWILPSQNFVKLKKEGFSWGEIGFLSEEK